MDGGPRTRAATAAARDGVPNAEAGNKAERECAEEDKDRQHGAATFRTNKRSMLQLSKCSRTRSRSTPASGRMMSGCPISRRSSSVRLAGTAALTSVLL